MKTRPFFQQKSANTFLKQEGILRETWASFAEGRNNIFNNPVLKAIAGPDTGKSPTYNDRNLATVRCIGTHKIHE